jgi:RimJ/RimL family protein N-acetyltransferase
MRSPDRGADQYAQTVLNLDYPIMTDRLILRPYILDDLDDLYEIQSRPEVTRYLYWGARDQEEVRESLEKKIRDSVLGDEGDALTLAVVLPETGTVIGDVLLVWVSRRHRQGEVGYIFHPDHGGRGYATEAAEVVLRLGFEELGLHRIVGRLDGRNTASARVLERLGLRREAHFVQNELVKGEWTDEVVYAMLADEWRARRPEQVPGTKGVS